MDDLYLSCAQCSACKHGEQLCGDSCSVVRAPGRLTAVLSDGLGSGVKANILSTLTAGILSTLMSRRLPVDECIETVATTLPVCRERRLAYSTFTVLQTEGRLAHLVQFDNPHAILLRGGKAVSYGTQVHFIGEKEIHESTLSLQEDDMLVFMSDGVTNAGIGKLQPGGWPRREVAAFLERLCAAGTTPQRAAAELVAACCALCLDSPDDDITAMAFALRRREAVNLMIGPPARREDDERICRIFFGKEGRHVVCGGSTAQMVSRWLNKPLVPLQDTAENGVPACAALEGADLVTEGVITLEQLAGLAPRFAENCQDSPRLHKGRDGVSQLAVMLFEQASDVNIFFGQAVNGAHTGLDIGFSRKNEHLKTLAQALERMGKTVKISLC